MAAPSLRVDRAVDDPRELFALALIEHAEAVDIPAWMERRTPIEERRHERIEHLVGEPTLNAVYQVVAEDDLSQPITE
ncbi:hypothetical protein ACFWF7_32915 [Nocardia sp. NPDC060256]|uniref:hypothetical protein n=1 Tax=unclassified Nocardia TaxID=2637762 RepID=UPI00365EAA2F